MQRSTEVAPAPTMQQGREVRIRPARPADTAAVAALSTTAGAPLHDAVLAAIAHGIAGSGLRAAAANRVRGGRRHSARASLAVLDDRGPIAPAVLPLVLALVAEQATPLGGEIVGALVAFPPVAVIGSLLRDVGGQGPAVRARAAFATATGMMKVTALAVTESTRRRGIGRALLDACLLVGAACGYRLVYGLLPATPGRAAFYRRCGCTVLPPGAGFDPYPVIGVHLRVRPAPDEQIFLWPTR